MKIRGDLPSGAALRITFGTHEENEKFIHALEEIMKMDKV